MGIIGNWYAPLARFVEVHHWDGISHHLWHGSRGYVMDTSGTVGRGAGYGNIASPMARQSGLCDIHLWVTNPNKNIIGTFSLLFNLKGIFFPLKLDKSKESVNGPYNGLTNPYFLFLN